MSAEKKDDLLLLFRVQKYRVLKKIDEGGKIPRAVEVSGCGVGSWKELTDALVSVTVEDAPAVSIPAPPAQSCTSSKVEVQCA